MLIAYSLFLQNDTDVLDLPMFLLCLDFVSYFFWEVEIFAYLLPSSIKCGVCHVQFFTHFDKPIFPNFRQFSKHLSDFKHSYLSQMTPKN